MFLPATIFDRKYYDWAPERKASIKVCDLTITMRHTDFGSNNN
jgi:hypothetical protein